MQVKCNMAGTAWCKKANSRTFPCPHITEHAMGKTCPLPSCFNTTHDKKPAKCIPVRKRPQPKPSKAMLKTPASSNLGRTPGFEPANSGSTPDAGNIQIHTYTGCPFCQSNIQPQIDAAYSKGFAAALGGTHPIFTNRELGLIQSIMQEDYDKTERFIKMGADFPIVTRAIIDKIQSVIDKSGAGFDAALGEPGKQKPRGKGGK
jgi:hypothetical protein